MNFASPAFLAFFVVVYLVYWRLRSTRSRDAFLLVASYCFYGSWDARFLALIVVLTLSSYCCALLIDGSDEAAFRRRILQLGIFTSLAILGFFKYFGFFTESLQRLAGVWGLELGFPAIEIILPVGISFFTFQSISYLMDVWRGRVAAERSLIKVALYIAFFPQLVAGPIVRAAHFLPQLGRARRRRRRCQEHGLYVFCLGFVYKVLIADNLSAVVDPVYADLSKFDNFSVVLATLGFHSQIYFDFAGYSFMAIGTALLLGYRIPRNFRYPYLACSLAAFWRRWHISLSSWLRDYLYIPLGGNRAGSRRTSINLMLTMVLGGLWHGASWTFVTWGAIHGGALVLFRRFSRAEEAVRRVEWARWLRIVAGFALTQLVVLLAWVFFRAENFADAVQVLRAFAGLRADGGPGSHSGWLLLILMPLLVDSMHGWRRRRRMKVRHDLAGFALYAVAGIALMVGLMIVPVAVRPFVYFQF